MNTFDTSFKSYGSSFSQKSVKILKEETFYREGPTGTALAEYLLHGPIAVCFSRRSEKFKGYFTAFYKILLILRGNESSFSCSNIKHWLWNYCTN